MDLPPRKVKGWVHEVRIPLVKGESLRWETRHTLGAGIIAFNLHSHKGREVTHHATADRSEASGTFPAPWAGDFYAMWEKSVGTRGVRHIRSRAGGEPGA